MSGKFKRLVDWLNNSSIDILLIDINMDSKFMNYHICEKELKDFKDMEGYRSHMYTTGAKAKMKPKKLRPERVSD